ncbi:DNA alkylation repair protein [bacterium]|nr:DNA alkylation repair protein [bacterium]
MAERKGARRRADIPKQVLIDLNQGKIEARTLAEVLAIDFAQLLAHALPEIKSSADRLLPEMGIVARMREGGSILVETLGKKGIDRCATHRSDTVRGWSACAMGQWPGLDVAQRLDWVRGLADDPNAGVREWAWLGVRGAIADDPVRAIKHLKSWTKDASERIRRFASESTRPRGVWCSHLEMLVNRPELGLPILKPLRADPSKYVQDSVSNWLNDAAKSQGNWVVDLCEQWIAESPGPATARICKRACRSLCG